MKKIYNIIDSELILRTNNHRLRQEFGEVGTSESISADGTTTIFTTKAVIREINYVTVNGLVLTEGSLRARRTREQLELVIAGLL
jgi:hypothetical protein